MSIYNYKHAWRDDSSESTYFQIKLLQSVPWRSFYRLDGSTIDIEEIYSSTPYTVVEFGSSSCPDCIIEAPRFEELALQYPKINVVMVYVREAHPGELHPCHLNFSDKLRAAQDFYLKYATNRIFLIDSLEGDGHRAFGSKNSMVYIIDRYGRIVFRVERVNSQVVRAYLDLAVQHVSTRRRSTHVEMILNLDWDFAQYMKILSASGTSSVQDFISFVKRQSDVGAQ